MGNMRILGIDYGLKKIGLAIGVNGFSEPWKVVSLSELRKILETEKFDKIVVGVSEGEMGELSKKFAIEIGATTYDETLTTKDAIKMSIEAGIGRKKRKNMEDAYASSLMLQNYLDSNILT